MAEIFPKHVLDHAGAVIETAQRSGLKIAVVETVTGGLLAAALTAVSGASRVFERGFVLYHSDAKATGLAADPEIAGRFGAVSAEVTRALADGLFEHSDADVGIAVTGYAGPTGGNEANPVGTVYFAGFDRVKRVDSTKRQVFGGDRNNVKLAAIEEAIDIIAQVIEARS